MTGPPLADAIVVAAGGSVRMGGIDKLAVEIGGRPLLAWTTTAMAGSPDVDRVAVVTSAERVDAIRTAAWLPAGVTVVVGGGRRQESVHAGLTALVADHPVPDSDRVILVQDGARPLVTSSLVSAVARAAREHGAAIPVVPVRDTIKRHATDGTLTGVGDRQTLAAAQTPQGVRRSLLEEAFRRFPADGADVFTDEAAMLEACNIPVHAITGDPRNLKVTVPGDLGLVEMMLFGGTTPRTGFGHDRHRFGPGEPLRLGGLEFVGAPRLHGHSDGDVALHAVADAILGAAGLGDLGRLFPADTRTERGIASDRLLAEVIARVGDRGLAVTSIDLTIVGARPRLSARLDAMGDRIAELVGLPPTRVSVKASTGNLEGMEGAGLGIAAEAIATVGPIR